MPRVEVKGKATHFPYTKKGKEVAKKAMEKMPKMKNMATSDGYMMKQK